MKKNLLFVAVLICCTVAAQASAAPAPPIDAAALAAYAHGNGAISGSVRFDGATQAVCAPDIPYVAWYVQKLKSAGPHQYDPQMIPYTHAVPIRKDRTFSCVGVAPGRYLVWVEGYTAGFPGPITESRQLEDPISGQVTPGYSTVSYGLGGSGPGQSLVGPEHVVSPEPERRALHSK